MWSLVWSLVCHCMHSFSVRYANHHWNTWIHNTDTIEKYKAVLRAMFSDGVMTDGRLLVLNTFTDDVMNIHPNIAQQIQDYKMTFLSRYQ